MTPTELADAMDERAKAEGPYFARHLFYEHYDMIVAALRQPEGGRSEERAIDLLCEMEGLIDAFASRVETLAFAIRAPNPHTPQLVQTVQYVHGELAKIKARWLESPQDAK